MKLLLVEDDADLARWVMNLMQVENFVIDWAQDGERAETLLGLQCYDAVLLDLRLPGIGGKDVLARLRRKRDNVPVLMLTANGSTDDKVACFSAGADDYVVKPFDARELVARIKALPGGGRQRPVDRLRRSALSIRFPRIRTTKRTPAVTAARARDS
jgi:DNA-binding response OmpR family regulator